MSTRKTTNSTRSTKSATKTKARKSTKSASRTGSTRKSASRTASTRKKSAPAKKTTRKAAAKKTTSRSSRTKTTRKKAPAKKTAAKSRSTRTTRTKSTTRTKAKARTRKAAPPKPVAEVDPASAVLVPPAVIHAASGRALPEFPKDDYDYTYLEDYLAMPETPKACRAVIFGCGRGEASVYLSERGFRVTGLDSDRTAIGLARERAWLNNRDVDFMIGDVFEISALLPAESFGLAIDRSVFQGIEGERERRRYLESIGRLLLPGGIMLLSATEVDLPKKAPRFRKSSRQSALLVQEGGPVVGEVIRAGLFIVGRHLYPVSDTRAELLLYCRK